MQYRGFAGDERRDAKSEVVSVCPLRVAATVTSTQQGKRRNPLAGNLEHAGFKQRAAMALLLTADLSAMQNGRMIKRPQSLGKRRFIRRICQPSQWVKRYRQVANNAQPR